jgi:uncharacterized protein with gpF-like domain
MPRQKKISEFLTECFRANRILEEDEYLEFDNSGIAILREDRQAQATLAQSLMPLWTLDEIRQEIFDKEPLGEGVRPAAYSIAAPSFPNSPIEDEEEVEEIENEDVEDVEDVEEEKDLDKIYKEAVHKEIFTKYPNAIKKGLEDQVSIFENEAKAIEPFVLGLLNKWVEESLPIVIKELSRADPIQKDTGPDETPKKIPSKRKLRKLLERVFDQDEETYVETTTEILADIPGKAFDTTVVTVINQENAREIEALKGLAIDAAQQDLAARSFSTFTEIEKTTVNQIFRTIEAGIKEGKGLRDIGRDISDLTGINQSRATTIARTEGLTANSLGQKAAMDSAAEVIDDLVKVWVSSSDQRTRGNPGGLYPDAKDKHWFLSGEVQDVDDTYSNNLEYPRDPKGPGYSVINCRCTQVILSKQDLDDIDVDSFKN